MPSFDTELRACLGEILGERPPDPDTDSLLFFGQWLAERNLGLVPIARASAFSWPGSWLARVCATDGDHAVVMFGSPPVRRSSRGRASQAPRPATSS